MLIKKIFSTALICSLSLALSAQFDKIEVKIGQIYNHDPKDITESKVHEPQDDLFVNPGNDMISAYWVGYDNDYHLSFDPKTMASVKMITDGKKVFNEKSAYGTFHFEYKMIGGRLYAFFQREITAYRPGTKWDPVDENGTPVGQPYVAGYALKACEIDMKTGAWIGAAKSILEMKEEPDNKMIILACSMDGARLAVCFKYLAKVPGEDGKKYAKYGYLVLDQDLNKVAGRDVRSGIAENDLAKNARGLVTVDSKNRLYIYNALADKKDGMNGAIQTIGPDETAFSVVKLHTGDLNMPDIRMQENEEDIYVAGIARGNGEDMKTAKVQIYKLSRDKRSAEKITDQLLDGETPSQLIRYKHISCVPHELICNPDGSLYFIYIGLAMAEDIKTHKVGPVEKGCWTTLISPGGEVKSQAEIMDNIIYGRDASSSSVLNNAIFEEGDIYFFSRLADQSGYSLTINKLHEGKLETKTLVKNISGVVNIVRSNDQTLIAEVVYVDVNDKAHINRQLVKVSLKTPYVTDYRTQKLQVGNKVVLKNVFFETDKYELKEESKTELNVVVGLLRTTPSLKIEIGGHTDNTGKEADNISLSQNRARAVYDYIVSKGIAASRLSYKGYAAAKPIADNASPEGKAKNRRTEFVVTGM